VTRFVESTITFPYRRSLGRMMSAFMGALTEKRILGIRNGKDVLVPPMEWDPQTGDPLPLDLIEVGPAGTVRSFTWVPKPSLQHPLDRPFAFAFIQLDGASTPLLHAVDAGSSSNLRVGARVAPRWRGKRVGRIDDIVCFVPGEAALVDGKDEGPATEPVTMMDYLASTTYRNPVPAAADRAIEATRQGRLVGQKCPKCGSVFAGGRGYCVLDAIELGPEHEVDLPTVGTITNYVVVTPVQYPGQTETEPFARVFVLVDDTEVVYGYQPVVDLPVDQVRVGRRVRAVFAPGDEGVEETGAMGGHFGCLLGWAPNGEPDVQDPDLVNRIF
jgi:uncharacterized OB-fold protein